MDAESADRMTSVMPDQVERESNAQGLNNPVLGGRLDRTAYKDEESAARATVFRDRLAELGLTIAEFRRRSGLTRNVVYALSKGKKPNAEQRARMSTVLGGQ